MEVSRQSLINKFKSGNKPIQQDFTNWLDSFHHKEDKVPISNIEGLEGRLNEKLDTHAQETIMTAIQQNTETMQQVVDNSGLIYDTDFDI